MGYALGSLDLFKFRKMVKLGYHRSIIPFFLLDILSCFGVLYEFNVVDAYVC